MENLVPDLALQNYAKNRSKFPAEALLPYHGKFVAWNPDATGIVCAAATRKALRELVKKAGQDPQECVIEGIP